MAAGVNLKFSDAQQKQENQIKAIRSYIQQGSTSSRSAPSSSPGGTRWTLSSLWTKIVIGALLLVFVVLQRIFVRRPA